MGVYFDTLVEGLRRSPLGDDQVVTATYTPNSGDPSTITAIWSFNQTLPEEYEDGQQSVASGVLRVDPADVTDPDDRDTATIDSVVYAVKSIGRRFPILELHLEAPVLRRVGGVGSRTER